MTQFDRKVKFQDHYKKTKYTQGLRMLIQVLFLLLLIVGFHKESKSVFNIFLVLSFVFGNYFCGWLCPFGTMQEIVGKIGSRIRKKKFRMSRGLQRYLRYSRYILAVIILTQILLSVVDLSTLNSYKTFTHWLNGKFVQSVEIAIMASFLIISLFFERPFCNYFCIEGIRYGLASLTRFFTIKRNMHTCIHCKKCDKACPMNIEISTNEQVRNAQCINCFKCISVCPIEGVLSYGKVNPFKKGEV